MHAPGSGRQGQIQSREAVAWGSCGDPRWVRICETGQGQRGEDRVPDRPVIGASCTVINSRMHCAPVKFADQSMVSGGLLWCETGYNVLEVTESDLKVYDIIDAPDLLSPRCRAVACRRTRLLHAPPCQLQRAGWVFQRLRFHCSASCPLIVRRPRPYNPLPARPCPTTHCEPP
jgi:hypothetical protein